jgi:hypothetical protein
VNLLDATQMTIRLYRICEKALKVVRAHIPDFSELECGQLAPASHALDLLGAAIEDSRQIMNVQHTLFAPHAIAPFREFVWEKACGFFSAMAKGGWKRLRVNRKKWIRGMDPALWMNARLRRAAARRRRKGCV